MGIFKRIKTIAKADINSLLDSMEDPIAMLNEYSREMELEIGKAQKALSRQLFVENKQIALILETKEIAERRARQAKLAVEKGDEQIAKLAIQEKINHEKQLSLYEQQLEVIKEQTVILKGQIDELQTTYQELQHKKILLASRANVAKSIKQIQTASSSFQADNIVRGVTRVEEKILLMEAEVQAGNYHSSKFTSYESANLNTVLDEEVNKELEKLKSEKEAI